MTFSAYSNVVDFTISTGGGSSSAALTFVASSSISQTNSPQTISIDIGTADTNRKVIFVALSDDSTDVPVTAVSINGVNCISANGGGIASFSGTGGWSVLSGNILFAWADVPTGAGAQDVIMTGGTQSGFGLITAATFTVDKTLLIDASPVTNSHNVTSAFTNTVTADTGDGGFVIAAITFNAYDSGNPLATASSVTASTDAMTEDVAFVSGGPYGPIATKKSGATASTPFSVTYGWSTNNSQALAAILTWR